MKTRTLAVGVTTALILSLTSAPGTAAAPSDPVQVNPDVLSTGAGPNVAYIDSANNLVRPNGTTVDYTRPMSHPMRAHHGYLVDLARWENRIPVNDVYFVPDHGKRRLLWKNSTTATGQRYYVNLIASVLSEDGRLVMLRVGRGKQVVKRVADGRTVASHEAARTPRTVAFKGRSVWLVQGEHVWDSGPDHQFAGSLARWNIDTGKVTQVSPSARARAKDLDAVAALNLSSGQIAVATGRRQLIRPLPGGSGPRWRTATNELVESWSPDGRYVQTFVAPPYFDVADHDLPATGDIRIRLARTGALVAEYRGLLSIAYPGAQSPVWERGSRSILMSAWSGRNDDTEENPYLTGHGYVRCTVSAPSCELALPRYDGEKLPSSLVNPFAAPRVR